MCCFSIAFMWSFFGVYDHWWWFQAMFLKTRLLLLHSMTLPILLNTTSNSFPYSSLSYFKHFLESTHQKSSISHRWTCKLCLWLQRVWSVQAQSLTIKSVTELLFWNVMGCALSRKRPGENKKCKLPELLPADHSLRVQWKENRLSLCSCLAPATLFSSLKWNSRMDRRRTLR